MRLAAAALLFTRVTLEDVVDTYAPPRVRVADTPAHARRRYVCRYARRYALPRQMRAPRYVADCALRAARYDIVDARRAVITQCHASLRDDSADEAVQRVGNIVRDVIDHSTAAREHARGGARRTRYRGAPLRRRDAFMPMSRERKTRSVVPAHAIEKRARVGIVRARVYGHAQEAVHDAEE